MKKVLFMICVLLLNSCGKDELKKPDFILGHWNRLNDVSTQQTYEIWKTDFTGIGFTLQNKDTIFKEILSIVEKRDTLYLQVEEVNEQPTLFKFTAQTDSSFMCENPKNQFPKKIKYWKTDTVLKAKVWNEGGSEITFEFLKDL